MNPGSRTNGIDFSKEKKNIPHYLEYSSSKIILKYLSKQDVRSLVQPDPIQIHSRRGLEE